MSFQAPRGVKDILPEEVGVWQFLEGKAREVFALYGFQEIRPPLFESTELFARSIGEGSDIVHKEMYTFTDQGGRSLTLRPEATASVVRAGIQHHLIRQDQCTKLYYLGPMFRQERPQAGRFRQFHQMGVEVFGSDSPIVDVEVMQLAMHLLTSFGLSNLSLQMNQVGCAICRPAYLKALRGYLDQHASALCEDCHYRISANALRVFDCKKESCQKVLERAPKIGESLCEACSAHAKEVSRLAQGVGLSLTFNDRLVRGLDYYTRTTFEIVSDQLGSQNAVCGGGRYDKLVKELDGPDVPGCGFALGVERVVMMLGEGKHLLPKPKVFVAVAGEEVRDAAFEWLMKLRQTSISAEMDTQGKSLKAQLRLADKLGVRYVVIFGPDELARGEVVLRELATSTQNTVPLNDLPTQVS